MTIEEKVCAILDYQASVREKLESEEKEYIVNAILALIKPMSRKTFNMDNLTMQKMS